MRDGWNLTGDAFTQDENGYFHFAARTDDMIISAGYNIAGPEVEAALLSHPDVEECAVIGAPDEERGQIVAGACRAGRRRRRRRRRPSSGCRITSRRPSRRYKYPRSVKFTDALPKTQTGKIQRFRLRPGRSEPWISSVRPHMSEPHNFFIRSTGNSRRALPTASPPKAALVFLAGQIGWNAEQKFDSDGFCRAGAPGAWRTSSRWSPKPAAGRSTSPA